MKRVGNGLQSRNGKAIISSVILLTLSLIAGTGVGAEEKAQEVLAQRDQSTITTGSGARYQTTVSRQTEGELSTQDLHQVSLLGSRVVHHLNEAVKGLLDQDPGTAKSELEKARKLTAAVRELLPVTTVTTVVKDVTGTEV
ncbi:MAG: hypothetical protein LJE60_05330 [Thiocapsa sp.]|nr:hypothetical protein [Thiocapsa sp.]MCG6896516.1 hypothetical protein [Thiocapsa sp.]